MSIPDKSHRHTVKQLESWQQSFENLRREFHRHGNHDGQRGCEFALEAIRQYQMAEPPTEPQVVGRVWNDEGQGTAQLNSVGRALPDDTPLYSSPVSATLPPRDELTNAKLDAIGFCLMGPAWPDRYRGLLPVATTDGKDHA